MGGSLKDLLEQAGFTGSPESPAEPVEADDTPEPIVYADTVVVRTSRKGQRGHTVTLVDGVLSGRERLLRTMRRQLGVGARLDGERLVFQGDVKERVARWIESQGVKKVARR